MTETQWNYSAQVQRWYWHKEDGKTLIAGNNGHEPLTYWFSVWKDGIEIAQGDELESIEEAKAAAEAVARPSIKGDHHETSKSSTHAGTDRPLARHASGYRPKHGGNGR